MEDENRCQARVSFCPGIYRPIEGIEAPTTEISARCDKCEIVMPNEFAQAIYLRRSLEGSERWIITMLCQMYCPKLISTAYSQTALDKMLPEDVIDYLKAKMTR